MVDTGYANDPDRSFCYDLGFGIESHAPNRVEVEGMSFGEIQKTNLIGTNISGLLFRDGYSGKNEFTSRSNYPDLVRVTIRTLLTESNASVLLIPHVYGAETDSESDVVACERIFAELRIEYAGRLGVLRGEYSPNEIRHLIGRCGFFVGSRMHACIAAVSQGIPAVSLAYSDKFLGVMRPVGADAQVVDLRTCTVEHLLSVVKQGFERRVELAEELRKRIPGIRDTILVLMCSVPGATKTFDHSLVTTLEDGLQQSTSHLMRYE
jgi:polysaccharide pyruvyl transferase WcaK-like protein